VQPFEKDVVSDISTYMNANQPDINLLIVQVHGGLPAAVEASLIDLDGETATFAVKLETGSQTVVIPWVRPIGRREHIRRELMELYETALEG
jgi:hypothetical protein